MRNNDYNKNIGSTIKNKKNNIFSGKEITEEQNNNINGYNKTKMKLKENKTNHKHNIKNKDNIKEKEKNNSFLSNFSSSTPRSGELVKNQDKNNKTKKINKKIIIILTSIFLLIIASIMVSLIIFIKKRSHNEEPLNTDTIQNDSDNSTKTNDDDDNPSTDQTDKTIVDKPTTETDEESYINNQNLEKYNIKLNQKIEDNLLIEKINKTISLERESIYKILVSRENNNSIILLKKCLNTETEDENENCNISESDINNINNLSLRNLNNDQEDISLCLFNLKNNIIESMKCPKNFSLNEKLEVLTDLNYFKHCLNDEDNKTECPIDEINYEKTDSNNNNGYKMKHYIKYNITSEGKENQIINIKNLKNKMVDAEKIINWDEDDENEESQNGNNYEEIVIFKKEIIDYIFSFIVRIEYDNDTLNASLILKVNNEKKNFEYISKSLKINQLKTINSELAKVKEIGINLTQNIGYLLEELKYYITQNIKILNENINENKLEEFSEIINKKESNEEFLNESNNVKNDLSDYLNKIGEDMKSFIEEINANISIYAEESHKLIKKVSEKMKHLKNVLNSSENIYSKIAIYYLNDTPTSYNDIIEKAINIFSNYYKNENESINKEIELLTNKFENGLSTKNEINNLYKYKQYLNESNIIDDNINEINNIISNLTSKIKEEIKKNISDNGYFISDTEISNNNDTYNKVIKEFLNVTSKLDNLEDIDKIYDELMINFKDNYTNLLKYLIKEGEDKFPLEENVLTKNYTQEKKQEIENLSNDIINNINNNYNLYLNNIKTEVEKIINSTDDLNSYIFDLNYLCSNESLNELSLSFENSFINFLNSKINYINKTLDNYLKYLNNDTKILEKLKINNDEIKSKKISRKKFNDIENVIEYINNKEIKKVLSEKFKNIIYKINRIMIINNYNITIDELSFINDNKNILEILNERIYFYFSYEIFKNKYEKKLENISIIDNDIKRKYNETKSLQYTNKCSDYYIYVKFKSGNTHCLDIFDESDEKINLNFTDIYSDNNFMIFKNKLDFFYLSLNQSINEYNTKMSSLLSPLEDIINNNDLNINIDLNPIENKINSLLSEKYEVSILNNCYNYYKSKTYDNIDIIFNGFLNLINNTFDDCADQLTNNLNKFKKSMDEFGYLTLIYQNIITQNITRNFFDTLIDNQKNNFNYTISYYYLLFINLVNSTKNNIINQLPINKNGIQFENIKNTINNKFNQLITKIEDSNKEMINIDTQTYEISVPRTNFFKANILLSNNVLRSRNILDAKYAQISRIDNGESNTEESLVSKFYLENSNSGKQIEDLYKPLYEGKFIILNKENFKSIIIDNFLFDKIEFTNKLNIFLYELNLKNKEEFKDIIENFTKSFENEIDNYFLEKNNSIIKIINELYNEFAFNESDIKEIYNNTNEILNKINEHLSTEKERIENEEISYINDYSKIEERLNNYKNNIINKIENKRNDIVNDFRNYMLEEIYNNKTEVYLNNYLNEIKENVSNFEEYKLLNTSYNLTTIVENIIEDLIKKYKELAKKQINYKYQMKLIELINIDYIKEIINNKINNKYKTLISTLKKFQKDSGNDIYDFNSTIQTNIEKIINLNLNNIENIFNKYQMPFSFYINQIDNWPTFNLGKSKEINSKIKEIFEKYINKSNIYEKNKLKEFLESSILDNFGTLLNQTINSYGKEYFKKIMNYNEIIKIKGLMNNIKSIFVENLLYYQILYEFKSSQHNLPNDLINKITDLNGIDIKIKNKYKDIMNKLNEEINNFINDLKDDIIGKYISDIKGDSIKTNFNDNIKIEINKYLNNIKSEDFEKDYYLILEKSVNESVREVYSQKLNESTNEIINIILKNKETIKGKIPQNENEENELEDINKTLVNIHELIDNYTNNYNYSFKISDEFITRMDEFYNTKLFNESLKKLNDIIDIKKNNKKTEINLKQTNITNELKTEDFNNSYNAIKTKMKTTINNIKQYIDNYTQLLAELKTNLSQYFNNGNEGSDIKPTINNESSIFANLISSSEYNKYFISNYDFTKKIDDCIKKLNNNFENSNNLIKNVYYEEEIENYFYNNLSELNKKYIDYYAQIKTKLDEIKNYFNESIFIEHNLLNERFQEELSILNKLYKIIDKELSASESLYKVKDINDTFSPIIMSKCKKYYVLNLELVNDNDNSFIITPDYNEIYNPKINANLKNKIKPNKMKIDIQDPYEAYKINLDLYFKESDDLNKYNITLEDFINKTNSENEVYNIENTLIEDFNILNEFLFLIKYIYSYYFNY